MSKTSRKNKKRNIFFFNSLDAYICHLLLILYTAYSFYYVCVTTFSSPEDYLCRPYLIKNNNLTYPTNNLICDQKYIVTGYNNINESVSLNFYKYDNLLTQEHTGYQPFIINISILSFSLIMILVRLMFLCISCCYIRL